MLNTTLIYLGIDVDDKAFTGTILVPSSGEVKSFKTRPILAKLIEKLLEFHGNPADWRICYESSYLGFSLARGLLKAGFPTEVIASSMIPELSSSRVKTDRLDSQKLAEYYAKGLLVPVTLPNEDDEAERSLTRSRDFVVDEIKRIKNHVNALTRSMGWNFKEDTGLTTLWGDKYYKWLSGRISSVENAALKMTFTLLLNQYNYCKESLQKFDEQIANLAATPKYEKKIQALTAYRGIEVLTAMKIVTEIGDIRRFAHPSKLMSYVGFDVCEYSSGGKERKFGITKMGNSFIRTALVEASQKVAKMPRISYHLKKRREGTDLELCLIADKCMARLHKKSYAMSMKNKNCNVTKVACARELTGFIWASMMKVA